MYEAIIIPDYLESNIDVMSFGELVRYGRENEVDVVEYEGFIKTLSPEERKGVPKKHSVPFFALFNPNTKKPMFVVCNKQLRYFLSKKTFDNIIMHERIHAKQFSSRNIQLPLVSPNDMEKYFSNKDEIMAFSWSIAKDLFDSEKTFEKSIKSLSNNIMWQTIKRCCGIEVQSKYKKYIYLYLEHLSNSKKENKE
jgi:hypothetical protein